MFPLPLAVNPYLNPSYNVRPITRLSDYLTPKQQAQAQAQLHALPPMLQSLFTSSITTNSELDRAVDLCEDLILLEYPSDSPRDTETREQLLAWLDFFEDSTKVMLGEIPPPAGTPITVGTNFHMVDGEFLTLEELLQLPELIRTLFNQPIASCRVLDARMQQFENYIFARYPEEVGDADEEREAVSLAGERERILALFDVFEGRAYLMLMQREERAGRSLLSPPPE